jgi:hypothetical protein
LPCAGGRHNRTRTSTLPRGRSARDLVGLALAAMLAGSGIHAWLAHGRAPQPMALASTGGRPASISAR